MKVDKIGERYHVRVEELLPCKNFCSCHGLMSCATTVWCPDGCHSDNNYICACVPCCMDCVHYYGDCEEWKEFPDKEKHRAMILGVNNNL